MPQGKRTTDRAPGFANRDYDEQLGKRVTFIAAVRGTARKTMFGGTCHVINDNMLCGVYQHFLILRPGEESAGEALGRPQIKHFDVMGRPMKGWVMVDSGVLTQADLVKWLNRARNYLHRLPLK
jgi:hypothetical protein